MARLLSGSAGSILQIGSSVGLTATPMTLALWFKRTSASTYGVLLSQSNGGSNDAGLKVFDLRMDADGTLGAQAYDGTTSGKQAVASNSTSWVSAVGIFASGASRNAYADGATGAANTASVAPSGISTTCIGAFNSSYGGGGASCAAASVAMAAGWSVALDANEIASLSKGFSPRRIRPQSLKFYISAIRDVTEIIQSLGFSVAGGSVADHPRCYGA